jgi:UDP-N-acetylmuramoyl-L-alanyl-D-glutamate--2,6-diaminopimelate ligase
VLEIPAKSLMRREIDGLAFDVAVVTDLGEVAGADQEALLARRRAKARLFRKVIAGGATVVNADDPDAELLGAVNLDAQRVSFGIERPADVSAQIERIDERGARLRLRGFDREAAVDLRLAGAAHVPHALAAAAVAWARELPIDAVVTGLETVTHIPGRLEPVHEGQDFGVWVDQAQSGAELRQALASLRAFTKGRIHCVFGAEGLRDRHERFGLAIAAEAGADRLILTSNNPRTEHPDQILDDLLGGLHRPGRALVEPDRRRAIGAALADAQPGDAVLIAGKGPRTFQIYADRVIPFDDKAIAAEWIRTRRGIAQRSSA